jgi:hypothetical protein
VPDHLDINAHEVNLSRGAPSFRTDAGGGAARMTSPRWCVTRGFAHRIAKFDLMLIMGRAKEGRATTTSVVAANASPRRKRVE